MVLFTATVAAALTASPAELPTAPPPRPATDPEVAKHLAAWKKAADGRKNVWAAVTVVRTDRSTGKETKAEGVFLAMNPNLFRFRLGRADDKEGRDFEAWICDGASLFNYLGASKTIVEVPLGLRPSMKHPVLFFGNWLYGMIAFNPGELFPLRCLTGLDAGAYEVTLVRAGPLAVELDFVPPPAGGRCEFERDRVRLAAPGTKFPYVPLQVEVVELCGDVAVWRFTNPQVDVPGVHSKDFRFEPVEGFKHLKPFETGKRDR